MPSLNDLREARAELQKMQAEMSDDRAFGMFSPALQKRITEAKKAIADLNVEVGKLRDAKRRAAEEDTRNAAEEAKRNRIRLRLS